MIDPTKIYDNTVNKYGNNYDKSLKKISDTKKSWFYTLSVNKDGVLVKRFALMALFDRLGDKNWDDKFKVASEQFVKLGYKVNKAKSENPHPQNVQMTAIANQAGISSQNQDAPGKIPGKDFPPQQATAKTQKQAQDSIPVKQELPVPDKSEVKQEKSPMWDLVQRAPVKDVSDALERLQIIGPYKVVESPLGGPQIEFTFDSVEKRDAMAQELRYVLESGVGKNSISEPWQMKDMNDGSALLTLSSNETYHLLGFDKRNDSSDGIFANFMNFLKIAERNPVKDVNDALERLQTIGPNNIVKSPNGALQIEFTFGSVEERDAMAQGLRSILGGGALTDPLSQEWQQKDGSAVLTLSSNESYHLLGFAKRKESSNEIFADFMGLLQKETNKIEPSVFSIEDLYQETGKFASYYTANKVPMMNFLKGLGCILDGKKTVKGDDFLQKEIYEIEIPDISDYHNNEPVIISVSREKIQSIMDSVKVVISEQFGIEDYKTVQAAVDKQVLELKTTSVRGINLKNDPNLGDTSYSAEMYACQICHSVRLPVLTNPYNFTDQDSTIKAHQQLSSTNLDEAPEIILINTPGANFAYGKGFRDEFIDKNTGKLKTEEFEEFLNGLWGNVIYSAIEQGATDLSLLPIGLGEFLKGLNNETAKDIKKSYLRSLNAILEDPNIKPKLEKQFKNGVFFTKGPLSDALIEEVIPQSSFIHFHDKDALNLSQNISAKPGHCCAILNPSDGDVLFGIYNVGEYWQTSMQGSSTHVGEEYLMHLIPGQLSGRDMCPEAFKEPLVSKL